MSDIGSGNALNFVNGIVTITNQKIFFSIETKTIGYSSTPASQAPLGMMLAKESYVVTAKVSENTEDWSGLIEYKTAAPFSLSNLLTK